MRTKKEIQEYCDEAFAKVWLSRSEPISPELLNESEKYQKIEKNRQDMIESILKKYPDIPENGYDDFEYGLWSGILAALRWVSGEEKMFLDT